MTLNLYSFIFLADAIQTNYENKNFPIYKALNHFDDFYKTVYGNKLWRSLRLGLLCNNKYCAVINNYSDPQSSIEYLENRGALNIRTLFELQYEKQKLKRNDFNTEKPKEIIQKMEEKMESLISDKEKTDKLSSIYCKYEKVPIKEKERVIIEDEEETTEDEDETRKSVEKLSLIEGLKDAHIDKSRIIHPKNSVSAATLFEFIPATQIKGLETWISEVDHYEYYKKSLDFPINVEEENYLNFPEHLNVFTFEKCNINYFPKPSVGSTGVLNGGSILPVLALDLKKGDRLLDMCGAPGGKSITAFQTLMPDEVVCNDISLSRINRIRKVVKEYLYDDSTINKFIISHQDGLSIDKFDYFNKILVDVPCTNDRISVNVNENNYFSSNRVKERLHLPELQCNILTAALKLVARGGTVVYSTCSLSPVQNDGVIQMALRRMWEETDNEIVVNYKLSIALYYFRDLSQAFNPANILYYIGNNIGMKYGIMVLPHLTANFGPMYFSKLKKLK
ncbi:hypothetical protein PGB90_008328 [Kerria lacca]